MGPAAVFKDPPGRSLLLLERLHVFRMNEITCSPEWCRATKTLRRWQCSDQPELIYIACCCHHAADSRGILEEDKAMKLKILTAATMIAAFVTPALAADDYYVVQDATTKKC